MNRYIKPFALGLVLAATMPLTSCLEEAFPTAQVTQKQVNEGEKDRIARSLAAFMSSSTSATYDIGVPTILMWRDSMGCDVVPQSTDYNYFSIYAKQTSIGSSTYAQYFWDRYYSCLYKANLILLACDPETYDSDREYAGNALAYRALFNMELSEFYEFFPTGVERIDQQAEAAGIYGLTVPLQTQYLTEEESRHNPRIPFQHMYRYILTDLDNAETYLADFNVGRDNTWAGLGTVYGLKARLYLNLATRFNRFPADLQKMVDSESDAALADLDKFGLTTARDYYAKASEYARKAINQGFTPLTQSEWYDVNNGFNTPTSAWMWSMNYPSSCAIVTEGFWKSWTGFNSPEAVYGICTAPYNTGRCINARLYENMRPNDWRRNTWIAPEEAGDSAAYADKYSKITTLNFNSWKSVGAYVGFKYRPGQGDGKTASNGNAVSVPLMRVEEMYFIEMEAEAYATGAAAGKSLLEQFMRAYRTTDGVYVTNASTIDAVVEEIILNKRIELWGEGQTTKDFNRLGYPIIKGYDGTNWPDLYRYNSFANYRAPWTILYIPNMEATQNPAVIQNPNCSQAVQKWTGN